LFQHRRASISSSNDPNDVSALRALFERGNEAPQDLARAAEEKCFGPGIWGSPAVRARQW
jgi:hypothetical protein